MEFTLKKPLLGAEIELCVYDIDKSLAVPLLEEAFEEGVRLQKVFNFYDLESELSLLNHKRTLETSPELLQVLKQAIAMGKETQGRYDVSLGKQFLEQKRGKKVSPVNCSYKNILIKGNTVTLTHPDVLIDLGSIAKGFIGDQIVVFFQKQGVENGFVDVRGDLRFFGTKSERIAIEHPRDKTQYFAFLELSNVGVATSGDYRQFTGDYDHCHILGKQELISVTVVAPTLTEADVFATAVFTLDEQERKKLLAKNPQIQVFTIDRYLKAKTYNALIIKMEDK